MKRYIPSHNADSSVQTVICKAQSVDSGEARCKNEQRGYSRQERDDIYNPTTVIVKNNKQHGQFFSLPLYRQTLNIIQVSLIEIYVEGKSALYNKISDDELMMSF